MTRPIVVAFLGILILGLTLPSYTQRTSFIHILPSLPKTYATTHNIALNGSAIRGWNNTSPGPAITIAESDSVVMSLTSTDGAFHQLYIDVNGMFDPSSGCVSGVDKCSALFGDTYPNPITTSPFQSFPAGTYTYYCSVHPWMTGKFVVRGFRISSTPNAIVVVRGSSAISTIALASVNGFSGTASISVAPTPTGLLTAFNSTSVSLAAGGMSAASLTVNATSAAAVGTYSVLVNATIGSISHTTSLTVVVKKPGFSLSPNPAKLFIQPGFSNTTNVTLTSLNNFNGTVALSITPLAGITPTFSPPNVNLTKGQSAISTMSVTVASSTLPNSYNLTLTGTSGPDTNSTIEELVIGQDFNLTASPLSLTILQGSSANSTITLLSLSSFKGSVTISSPSMPAGLAISFNTTFVNLSANQAAYVSVTISASRSATPKVYDVPVTGTNNNRVRSVNFNATISGFTIQTSPASFNLTQGRAESFIITLTSVNGFSGTMNLTATGSSALTRSLAPSSATLTANRNLAVTLSVSANSGSALTPAGSYVFNVTGSVGSLSHSTIVTVTVLTLPPTPTPPGSFPTALVAGTGVLLIAILSITLFLKRKSVKAMGSPVPRPS